MPLLTPAELQLYSTYNFSQQTSEFIALMINRAQVIIDAWCVGTTYSGSSSGSLLESQEWTEHLTPFIDDCCDMMVTLNHRPVTSISAITLNGVSTDYGNFTDITLDPTVARIDNEAGYFEYPSSNLATSLSGVCAADVCVKCYKAMVDVTYTAGFDPIPEDLKKACAMLVEQMTLTAVGSSGSVANIPIGGIKSFRSGSYAESYQSLATMTKEAFQLTLSLNVLEQVELILNKYRMSARSVGVAGV